MAAIARDALVRYKGRQVACNSVIESKPQVAATKNHLCDAKPRQAMAAQTWSVTPRVKHGLNPLTRLNLYLFIPCKRDFTPEIHT